MRKLKICYLADWKSIHTQRWLRYFVDRGHEVHLITNCPTGCKELKGVNLHNFVIKGEEKIKKISWWLYVTLRSLKLRRLLRKINPDILHSHFVSYYGWWGAKSGFHPFVLTAWGSDIYVIPKQSAIGKAQIEFALKNADLITSDSENLRKATIELGASFNNNYVIQWGVDLSKFNPQIDNNEIRKDLNIDGSLVILSTRSFKPIYNIDVLIHAIPLVLSEIPNAKFILKNSYGDEEKQMQQLVNQLGVGSAVRFVGSVNYDEMAKYYTASDIFVSIPSSDSTSISLLEAMACGVAPIVSDLPSPREWIKDGWNGYIVPVRDTKALAGAIVRLLKDEQTRKLFAQRNLALVGEKADHKKHMQRMEELYYRLIKNRGAKR